MTNHTADSIDPVNYIREILIPLKSIELECDNIQHGVEDPSKYRSAIIDVKVELLHLIRVTDNAIHFADMDSESDIPVIDDNVCDEIQKIYESFSVEELKSQLRGLKDSKKEPVSSIPISQSDDNLSIYLSVVDFVASRLNNDILRKLKQIYSVVETIDIDDRKKLLSDIKSCISAILTTCENYRTISLYLISLDSKLLSAKSIENIRTVCKVLSMGHIRPQNKINQ